MGYTVMCLIKHFEYHFLYIIIIYTNILGVKDKDWIYPVERPQTWWNIIHKLQCTATCIGVTSLTKLVHVDLSRLWRLVKLSSFARGEFVRPTISRSSKSSIWFIIFCRPFLLSCGTQLTSIISCLLVYSCKDRKEWTHNGHWERTWKWQQIGMICADPGSKF